MGQIGSEARRKGGKKDMGNGGCSVEGRGMAVDMTEGLVKVLTDPDNDEKTLGVTIVGPEAADLICECALAMEMHAFAQDVALTVHPHPTLGEGVMEAFKHALGEAVHVMNKK